MAAEGLTEEVRRAQEGDADAFAALYHAHAGRVYALCLRLTGNAAAAEERLQDVFVRAWEQLPKFRGEAQFGTWLHRLAVNTVISAQRAAIRRERLVQPVEEPEALGGAHARSHADAMDLERAIAALPPGARSVFVLHDIEGYQHQEIATMAGIAEGTSKAQLFRARRLLREMLDR